MNYLISQYADDTIVTLAYSENNLKITIEIFELYAKYSGLKVNYDKTEIMPLGSIKYNYNILLPESRMRWTTGPITSLGVKLCHRTEDLIKLNYSKAMTKITNNIKIWSKRYLTLYGKIVVLNTFIISQFVYMMSVLPGPSEDIITQVNTIIFDFVWNNKPDKIKRNVMKLPKHLGGLSVPDIVIKNMALKIAWVPRSIGQINSWNVWLYQYFPIAPEIFWR